MVYLVRLNESTMDKDGYQEIETSTYTDELFEDFDSEAPGQPGRFRNVERITEKEVEEIQLIVGFKEDEYGITDKYLQASRADKRIRISKNDQEWFYVSISFLGPEKARPFWVETPPNRENDRLHRYYKCDQLYGLINCISSDVFKF